MSLDDSYALVDMLRGVVDKGTGRAIRQRFGIKDDVAGKTGTTQNNADGWFILMHPHLVAGAWAGFNDARITLRSDHWGQGARSALPMVGDFTAQVLRRKDMDRHARFTPPDTSHWWSTLAERVRSQWKAWWADHPAPQAQSPQPPVHRAPPAPVAPVPQPSEPDMVIEESTPPLPMPSRPAVPPAQDDLDHWMQQWQPPGAAPEPEAPAADLLAHPPAVVGR